MSKEAALSLFKALDSIFFFHEKAVSYLNCDGIDECSSTQFDYFHNEFETALIVSIPERIVSRTMLVP
jgi:hypothetical protein